MRELTGRIYPLSAPTAGWVDRIPLPKMPEDTALALVNLFPDTTGVRKRNGYEAITAAPFTSGCESVMSFNKSDGTVELLAAGDLDISVIDLSTGLKTAKKGACTVSSNRWQHVQFYDSLFCVNGADRCLRYTGTGDFAAAGFTMDGSPDDDLAGVHIYKERLYFIKGASLWYGDTRAVSGALTELDLSYQLSKGGYFQFCGSSTFDIGDDSIEALVVVSSQGEVLVFSGSDPEDTTTWKLHGHFYIGRPFGNRSFFSMGDGCQIVTESGVYALADIVAGKTAMDETGRKTRATEDVDKAFSRSSQFFGSLYGWEGLYYPRGNMMIVNVPLSATVAVQFVMNTLTGAWCQFTGMNAECWCESNRFAYFGGFDGHLYRFDTVQNDNGSPIYVHGETAFTACDDITMKKAFALIRAIVTSTADVSLTLGINTDFRRGALESPVSIEGGGTAIWDSALWDAEQWADLDDVNLDWHTVAGSGLVMNVTFTGLLKDLDLEILGFFIQYNPGGAL